MVLVIKFPAFGLGSTKKKKTETKKQEHVSEGYGI